MPAVSIKRNLYPLYVIISSIVSLVVPLMSDTMALSSFNIVFNKVDLPALGCPTIDIGIPCLIAFPNFLQAECLCRCQPYL